MQGVSAHLSREQQESYGFGESGITGIPLLGLGESGITGIPLEYDIAMFVTAIAMMVITSELVRFAVRDIVFSPE